MAEIIRKKKPELTGSLLKMKVGEELFFPNRTARHNTVRDILYRLNKQGYYFVGTIKGLPTGIKVTRIK